MALQNNFQKPADTKVSKKNEVIDFKNYKNFTPRPQTSVRPIVNLHDLIQKNIIANDEVRKSRIIIYSSVAAFIALIFLIGLI